MKAKMKEASPKKDSKLIYVLFALAVLIAVFFLITQNSHPGKEEITFTNSADQQIPVHVEIADDFQELEEGLMFRESLPEDEGMLFVFPRPGNYAFWMKDTLVPLDAIYMDENSTVVGIVQMEPCIADPCPAYAPDSEALYVLEVNKGFSERHGIELGSRMTLK
ncbi:MAG: DUF192 domain-containing protein [Candidatus ainarchaeum sp.]|nr:DUF192 domain-containing protein [Candidatus ainarchaeum sp.]